MSVTHPRVPAPGYLPVGRRSSAVSTFAADRGAVMHTRCNVVDGRPREFLPNTARLPPALSPSLPPPPPNQIVFRVRLGFVVGIFFIIFFFLHVVRQSPRPHLPYGCGGRGCKVRYVFVSLLYARWLGWDFLALSLSFPLSLSPSLELSVFRFPSR